MVYAVMERCGNFSHTLEEFDSLDEASEFIMTRALQEAKNEFTCLVEDIPEVELEIELENKLSYYNIEEWN